MGGGCSARVCGQDRAFSCAASHRFLLRCARTRPARLLVTHVASAPRRCLLLSRAPPHIALYRMPLAVTALHNVRRGTRIKLAHAHYGRHDADRARTLERFSSSACYDSPPILCASLYGAPLSCPLPSARRNIIISTSSAVWHDRSDGIEVVISDR